MKKVFLIKRILLFFFILSSYNSKAQNFSPALATMLQDTLNYYFTAIGNIKGLVVSVYLPEQGMWQSAKGVSYAGQPITQDMKFDVGSNTKLFVAAAMLKLQENNILNLDDHLYQWLPPYPYIDSNITIRQLLNHTSGVPDVIFYPPYLDSIKDNPTRVFTSSEVIGWVTTSDFPAGTSWSYSNTNYILASMVAQAATGIPIFQYLRNTILTSLSMDSSFFDSQEPIIGTIAHRWWNGITNPTLTDYHSVSRVSLNTAVGAAGGLFSTSSEMAQWYNALFNGQVLTPASMAQLTTFVTIPNNNIQQYGLGLYREKTQGFTYWEHGGATWGYKSKMMYDSCSGMVVCGLANAYPSGMTSIPFLLYRVVKNHVPGCAGIITGSTNVCQGQNNVTYTTSGINNASSYMWTLPNGATGTSTTNSITVNYGSVAVSGMVSVSGVNAYGVGSKTSLSVQVNPLPNVVITASANPICMGNAIVLQAQGASGYLWQPTGTNSSTLNVSPMVSTTFTVTGTSISGCTSTQTISVMVDSCMWSINLKLFLQGYYVGNGFMNPALFNQSMSANNTITDSITVELRSANLPYTMVATSSTVLGTNGVAHCNFSGVLGNHYIVVRQRNHVEIWSANPIMLSNNLNYDFSTASNQVYGNNQVEVESGVWAMYVGDINQDYIIDAFDYILQDPDIIAGAYGYLNTDLTGDGVVDAFDYILLEENLIAGLGAMAP